MAAATPPINGLDFKFRRFALFLAVALMALFLSLINGSSTLFYRDFGVLAYPTVHHHKLSFWNGDVPLWNPYSNCGTPFLAQWGTMVLYPFSLFYILLPLPWSLNVFCVAHLFWAGIGTFCVAQRWMGNTFAASVAGLLFVFNGVVLSSMMWPNYCVALGWMPWVIWSVERAWEEGRQRRILAAIMSSTFQLLAGVPELVLLTWFLLGLLFITGLPIGTAPIWRRIVRCGIILIAAAGLSAAQLLPFFDLLQYSQRDAATATLKWALPPWGWGNFIVPMFRCAQSSQGIFFQLGEDFFASTYLGLLPLVLAVPGIFMQRARRVWVLALATVICVLLAFGENGWLYSHLRQQVPKLGLARYPVKFMLLPAFAIPMMAAYGIHALAQRPPDRRRWVWGTITLLVGVMVLGIGSTVWFTWRYPTPYDQFVKVWQSALFHGLMLLAAVWLLYKAFDAEGRAARTWYSCGLFLGLIADAHLTVPQKNPVLPASVMASGLWQLQNRAAPPRFGEGRVMISAAAEDQLLISHVPDFENDFIGKRLALWSNLHLLEQVPKVNGSSTLQIREQKEIEKALYSVKETNLPPMRRFLNVAFVTAPGQVVDWNKVKETLPLITGGQQPIFADGPTTLNVLTNGSFNPAEVVYLPLELKGQVTATNRSTIKIESPQFDTHDIQCTVEAPARSLLVIAQTYYHAWHAYVDGQSVPLWRANYAFQALEVPPGKHQVKLVYEDKQFRLGGAISFVFLLGCGFSWFVSRKPGPPEAETKKEDEPPAVAGEG